MAKSSIAIITLCRDNPEELSKTLNSVKLQTEYPDYLVVLDGSQPTVATKMRELAELAGAKYHWRAPEGIYTAMRASLELVPKETYLWWVNSSDWLLGSRSVEFVRNALQETQSTDGPKWLVGELVRRSQGKFSLHFRGGSENEFLSNMRRGRAGFPHPSTLFWKPDFLEINPFNDGLRVASDFATALSFAKRFGAPAFLASPLAVHVPHGFTSKNLVGGFLEKSLARLRTWGWKQIPLEIAAYGNFIVGRFVFRSHVISQVHSERLKSEISSRWLGHFCDQSTSESWPECCDRVLER